MALMEYEDIVEEVSCFEKLARLLVVAPAPVFSYSANNTSALCTKSAGLDYGKKVYNLRVGS